MGDSMNIRGLSGQYANMSFTPEDAIVFGRNIDSCNVIFSDETKGISRMHCRVDNTPQGVTITDLGSSYGTYVNGVKIQPHVPVKLNPGDTFYLGDRENMFSLSAAGASDVSEGGNKEALSGDKSILIAALAVAGIVAIGLIAYAVNHFSDNPLIEPGDSAEVVADQAENADLTDDSYEGLLIYTLDANEDAAPVGNVQIKVYNGEDTNGEAVDKLFTDAEGCASIPEISDGTYTLKYECDGYYTEIRTITVSEGRYSNRQYMLHKAEDSFAYILLTWNGSQDLDLSLFNSSTSEYIRSYAPEDRSGNFLYADNDSSKGYELIGIRDWDAPFAQVVYALDTASAVSGAASSMEADGLEIRVYNSDGVLYQGIANPGENAALYSPGYLYQGRFYDEPVYKNAIEDGSWARVDKGNTDSVENYRVNSLKARITEYNDNGIDSLPEISIYESNSEAGTRNKNYTWDKSVFYSLEDVDINSNDDGLIYGYTITRKRFVNADSKNIMDYEIYSNPNSGRVNKITSIEYDGDLLHITDFYYDDQGRVNFIFVRDDINYTPTYARPTIDGHRFYFNNDCMIRWRIVSGGDMTNLCIGEASADGMRNPKLYDDMSDSEKADFDKMELWMLNAAYNTWRVVLSEQSICSIIGYVYDDDSNVVANATVELCYEDNAMYVTHTDGDGKYLFYVPSEVITYTIRIEGGTGCVPVTIYNVSIEESSLDEYMDIAWLVLMEEVQYTVRFDVTDAFNYASDHSGMARVNDAEICIRSGMNNRDGDIVYQIRSDSSGYATITLSPGMYTAEISKTGYDILYINFYVNRYEIVVYASASPKLADGEVRIVLTWGEIPYDLDSHLFTPYDGQAGEYTDDYHIWYSNMGNSFGDNLDVDDTTSYGPETITIPAMRSGQYKYYVVDYTNSSVGNNMSSAMSASGATVRVYTSRGLEGTWHVPTGRQGVIWEVFEMRNGFITPINRYYTNTADAGWWEH